MFGNIKDQFVQLCEPYRERILALDPQNLGEDFLTYVSVMRESLARMECPSEIIGLLATVGAIDCCEGSLLREVAPLLVVHAQKIMGKETNEQEAHAVLDMMASTIASLRKDISN